MVKTLLSFILEERECFKVEEDTRADISRDVIRIRC